jgi:hypothetical protein
MRSSRSPPTSTACPAAATARRAARAPPAHRGRPTQIQLSFVDRAGYDAYLTDADRAAGWLLDGLDLQRRLLEVDDVG